MSVSPCSPMRTSFREPQVLPQLQYRPSFRTNLNQEPIRHAPQLWRVYSLALLAFSKAAISLLFAFCA